MRGEGITTSFDFGEVLAIGTPLYLHNPSPSSFDCHVENGFGDYR